MAHRLQGAVRQLLQNYKETIHEKSPNCDWKQLLAAVEREDIVALKELESSGIFSAQDIIRAAIDKDKASVVEEFKAGFEKVDEADGLGPLLDYSIQKRTMGITRKLSEDFKHIGDRALPLFIAAIREKDMDYVNQLLDNNIVNLHELDENPMHIAARLSSTLMIQSLCSRNMGWVHATGRDGRTPLHVAAENGCKDVCEALLQHGARADAIDRKGRNPLHGCVERSLEGSLDCMEVLLKNKRAIIDMKNKEGLTPFHVAAKGIPPNSKLLLR